MRGYIKEDCERINYGESETSRKWMAWGIFVESSIVNIDDRLWVL